MARVITGEKNPDATGTRPRRDRSTDYATLVVPRWQIGLIWVTHGVAALAFVPIAAWSWINVMGVFIQAC